MFTMAAPTKAKRNPRPVKTVPAVGTYLTDVDRTRLYRIEAVDRKEGVVLEDCRTYHCFMLTLKEYMRCQFKEVGA